jgi:thiol:disulfide interchange protein DsbA
MTAVRRIANITLPLAGLGVIVFYNFCGTSCTFVKGELLGIDLKYLGLAYAALLFVLPLMKRDTAQSLVLSLGIGTEVDLVAYQVRNGTYCPYCLIFAAILVVLFVFNFRRSRLPLIGAGVALGFLFFLLFFKGAATPVYADEVLMPIFGEGKVQVRLYTDYLCGPCSGMEPKIQPVLRDLVRKKAITLTLVDTPIHAQSPLYARYFLYLVSEHKSFDEVLRSRAVLFEAAKEKVETPEKLEEYLLAHGVTFKEIDPRPTFAALSALISEDKIHSTPTCVIVTNGKKGVYTGKAEITRALDLLK